MRKSNRLIIKLYVLCLLVLPLSLFIISTNMDVMAAPVPANLRVIMSTAGNNDLTVSWSQSSGPVTGYWLSRSGQIIKISTTSLTPNYIDSGLNAGQAYVYKVASSDAAGVSPWSLKVSGTTKTGGSYTKPHAPFTDNTNMCQACHSIHMAPTAFKTLYKRYSNLSSAYSTALSQSGQNLPGVDICFNCHDGSGAGYNVKQYYDQPTSANVPWPGHMTRRAGTTASEASFRGWKYIQGLPAGSRLPCMVCHDSHVSSKGNWKIMADGLVDYAKSPSGAWGNDIAAPYDILSDATSTGVVDLGNNAYEKCTVCHHDGSRTNGIMRVAGLDLYWPSTNNGTPGGELDVKDHATQTNCDCHAGASTAQNNVHALGKGGKPSSPASSCTGCHPDVVSRTMSSAITSRHYLTADNSQDQPSTNPDRCTSKCHNNHGERTPSDSNNLYVDAPSRAGAANYDFTASVSAPGLCLSCHQTTQTSTRPGGTSNSTAYISPISPQLFISSAHSYSSTGYKTLSSRTYTMTCLKCHRDNDQSTTYSKWGPHASANRSLLYLPATQLGGNAGDEEQTCFSCHSPSKDQWASRTMATVAWRISQAFNQSPLNQGHRMLLMSQTVDRHRASEGKSFKWLPSTARHVECADCHNPHNVTDSYAQRPITSPITNVTSSLGESPTSGLIAGALRGVWGVSVSFSGLATAANYIVAVGPPPANYTYTASATKQWMICLKCHSSYGYGTSSAERPLIPSNMMGGGAGRQTDQVLEFNPANFSNHPIFARGRNQPTPGMNRSNWEGGFGLHSVAYGPLYGGQANVSGLTSAFVPPWGASSIVTCSDCHSQRSTSYSRNFYTTASNASYDWPRGPHGSASRWILRGLDRSITYRRNTQGTWSYASMPNENNVAIANENFCQNCHRADVYGYAASSNVFPASLLSRISHGTIDAGRGDPWGTPGGPQNTAPRIFCMYCHGGATRGGIHGNSKTANTITAGQPMGRRMLNGAKWKGYNFPSVGGTISCDLNSTNDDGQSVSGCTRNENQTNQSGPTFQYNYFGID